MIGITMCSGIGAPELAAPWVDWRLASEIEPFPRAVLNERFGYKLPEDQNQGEAILWGDMTEITPDLLRSRGIPQPDLVVAGTPCQAFSVAGLRNGTADARGNLTLKFVEILHDLVAVRPSGKLAVVWENVPGILSDKGNAFGCFLGGLVGAVDALQPPTDGSWPSEGMVQGPRARAAWAVLDAQWFGVAQRRRRVFVVIDFGGCIDPAAILLEPDSLRGDSPPRREAGQSAAPTLAARTKGGGGLGADFDCDGGLIQEVVSTLDANYGRLQGASGQDASHGHSQLVPQVSHALRGEGFDASEDGTGRGTPIVTVAFDCKGTEVQYTEDGSHPTLRSMGHSNSHQNAGGHAAVAFDMRGRDGGAIPEGPHPTANIRAASGGSSRSYLALPWAVRRLTPRECERLQGMPDDHTLIGDRPTRRKLEADELAYLRETYPDLSEEDAQRLAADGPRYKAIGNSMAVPVMQWILDRVRISHRQTAAI
jgi:DNA (cytosine-5)-methyltransferase 1